MRLSLPPAPKRVAKLPLNERGYPVPWFVATIDGKPDFRVIARGRRELAVKESLCWICGEKLGRYKAFVIGPMCAINRVTSEPPCHQDCADYAATACPWLTHPKMDRRPENLPAERSDPPGFSIDRNPGVALVWTTASYDVFSASVGNYGWLIRVGPACSTKWFAEGRVATREEVLASVDSGMEILLDMALKEGADSVRELERQRALVDLLLPAAAPAAS